MQRIHKVLGEAGRNAPSRHTLSAPAAGRVTGSRWREGDALRAGAVLVVMQSKEKQ
ncbi:MAG: hypothetical protein HY848_17820 [Betaproteobacteria bacterium]|nr:hypothetical protein [Betaproteobacteria bacterium]